VPTVSQAITQFRPVPERLRALETGLNRFCINPADQPQL